MREKKAREWERRENRRERGGGFSLPWEIWGGRNRQEIGQGREEREKKEKKTKNKV